MTGRPAAARTQERTEVLVLGASLGGVMAAWRAAHAGRRVLLLAEHDWLGGQMTAQAVPPDEHRLIEQPGSASESYLAFRADMRRMYGALPGFLADGPRPAALMGTGGAGLAAPACGGPRPARWESADNPGGGWVSRLCVEPALAAVWFERLLAPQVARGQLTLRRGWRAVAARGTARRLEWVEVQDTNGRRGRIAADLFIDATDTGELLHLAGLPCRLGKEARAAFDEPDAPVQADPRDQQPVTHVFALRWQAAAGPIAPPPEGYTHWREARVRGHAHLLFSAQLPGRERGTSASLPFSAVPPAGAAGRAEDPAAAAAADVLDWWRYRRIVNSGMWADARAEVSLINWAQNDCAESPLLDGPLPAAAVAAQARELSAAFLHWLQTEAPRPEGGRGFPEWQPAPDMLGTADGFAQALYVRESRRLVGIETLTQRALLAPPARRDDSVGIAWYPMDLHPTCVSGQGANAAVWPFELPLGVFVPQQMENLLPGCKNIATTQLAGACTRVHPAEWLVGEVAGLLAATLLEQRLTPQALAGSRAHTQALRARLAAAGIPAHWPDALLAQAAPGTAAH